MKRMAEGLAQQALGRGFVVASAGFRGSCLNPMALKVMSELGIDISPIPSRSLRDLDTGGAELAINLCYNEMAPILAGRIRRLDWPVPDPAKGGGGEEEQLERFRAARDILSKRLQDLAKELRQPSLAVRI
jgi:arsenate reductase